ncbi:MAG: M81 family metallopeptidase [Planctomycetaceae bacterium]|jgi:microcystin degradation protein MlrC
MPHRVLLAGLFHETHTFLAGTTPLAQFQCRKQGELLTAAGDGSPLAGVLEVAHAAGWELLPAIDLRASPGPIVAEEVVEEFWHSVATVLDRELPRGLDGVCLVLHGAGVSQASVDLEAEILRRLRARIGPNLPVGGVLDLHGNISPEFATQTQAFVAYRQNPHADACEAARDGARLLDRLMRTGEHAVTLWAQPPVLWPPPGTGTAFEPMRSLEALARQLESTTPGVLAINVFAGFSFADTPHTGVSFTAITVGEVSLAQAALQQLCDLAWQRRAEGNVREEPLDRVLAELAERGVGRETAPGTPGRRPGPVVLAEPSDNIGGGAPGDATVLLARLIEGRFANSVAAIDDPATVAQLATVTPGSVVNVRLGGRGSPLGGPPLALRVRLLSRGPGRFALEDRHSHLASMAGDEYDMGPCAVLRVEGLTDGPDLFPAESAAVRVLVTSHKTPPFDLGQWRSQGIIPESLDLIAVKAAVAHRRVYDPILSEHRTVETPGPCGSHLALFPWRHVRRPAYPLDTFSAQG